MATTSVLSGNNRQSYGDYHFTSLTALETILEARLAEMKANSELLFRIYCDTSCGIFTANVGYVVRLFRGATTSYATGYIQTIGGLTLYLTAKGANGWVYAKVYPAS